MAPISLYPVQWVLRKLYLVQVGSDHWKSKDTSNGTEKMQLRSNFRRERGVESTIDSPAIVRETDFTALMNAGKGWVLVEVDWMRWTKITLS